MLEEDRDAIRKMKEDFERLADLTEEDVNNYANYELRMNHYNTVYSAATRNASRASEYPGYDVGDILYMDYQEMLTRYLMRFRDLDAQSEIDTFRKVLKVWEHYKVLMKWNMRAFAYLTRYYIVNHSKPSLQQVALGIFLEQLFKEHADVVGRVTQELLVKERADAGVPEDASLITSAIDLFSSMTVGEAQSMYADKFLHPFLARTRADYEANLREWGASLDTREYLKAICRALAEEDERCLRYFPGEGRRVVVSCVEGILIDSPITREKVLSVGDGFRATLETRDETSLKQYYELFSRKESGVQLLADLLRQQLIEEGTSLSREHEDDETAVNVVAYVTSMMKLQDTFPHLLSTCFRMDFTMSKAVREGLEHAYNSVVKVRSRTTAEAREVPFCEWLAHYVDVVLQSGKGPVKEEIERIVGVLSYVTERDRFIISSQERMAERILFPPRRFEEADEEYLIQRIRQRCGPASTAYLEGMLKDVVDSRQFNQEKLAGVAGGPLPFEVTLLVAKKGIWPLQILTGNALVPPAPVQAALDNLHATYLIGTQGRVLTWSHESSSAEIVGHFKHGSYVFSLSGVQAFVLMCFCDRDKGSMTVGDILSTTGLSLEQLGKALPPITRSKVLLHSGGASPFDLQVTDRLAVNDDFASHQRRIRLPRSLVRVSVSGVDETTKRVREDRKSVVDACLMRIMKSHRSLEHADLVDQCQRQLVKVFSPDVKLIKQRIEDLLSREFIERDPSCATRYRYLA